MGFVLFCRIAVFVILVAIPKAQDQLRVSTAYLDSLGNVSRTWQLRDVAKLKTCDCIFRWTTSISIPWTTKT